MTWERHGDVYRLYDENRWTRALLYLECNVWRAYAPLGLDQSVHEYSNTNKSKLMSEVKRVVREARKT